METAAAHCALARALVNHIVNTPLAIVVTAVDEIAGQLDPNIPLLRERVEHALDAVSDARIGVGRLRSAARILLTGIPLDESRSAVGVAGHVLVVTADASASASVCDALRGDAVTVCNTVAQALQIIERSEPFEVIFCDALLSAAFLLVRIAWQEPSPRIVFMATSTGDPAVADFLQRHASYLEAPLAAARVRELAFAT